MTYFETTEQSAIEFLGRTPIILRMTSRPGPSRLIFAICIFMLGAIFFFQNCTVAPRSHSIPSDQRYMQGNGSGYDGKTFVYVGTRVCSDGKVGESAIELRQGKYYLIRSDCRDLARADQRIVEVVVDPENSSQVHYQGQLYLEHIDRPDRITATKSGLYTTMNVYPIVDGKVKHTGPFIGKFDESGKPIWAKNFGRTTGGAPHVRTYAVRKDGGVIVGGSWLIGAKPEHWVIRLSPNGERIWARRIVVADRDFWLRLVSTDLNGDVTIFGHTTSQLVVVKLSAAGELLHSTAVLEPFNESHRILVSPEGEAYILGKMGTVGNVVHLTKLSANGEAVWSHRYAELTSGVMSLADDGALVARILVAGKGQRFAEFHADGSLKRIVRLTDSKWANIKYGNIVSSGAGEFYATFPLSDDRTTVAKIDRDFRIEWAESFAHGEGYRFISLNTLGTEKFKALMYRLSSLVGTEHMVYRPTVIGSSPTNCATCTIESIELGTTKDKVTIRPGPTVQVATDVSVIDVSDAEEFPDAYVRLPMEK